MTTASQRAKQLGAKSVVFVGKMTKVPERTLHKWFHTNPAKFDALVLGALEMKARKDAEESNA